MAKLSWRTTAEIEQEKLTQAWEALRAERDRKLRETDWTQLADTPLAAGDKTAWVAYRQALRDLPQSTVDPRTPEWPLAPGA